MIKNQNVKCCQASNILCNKIVKNKSTSLTTKKIKIDGCEEKKMHNDQKNKIFILDEDSISMRLSNQSYHPSDATIQSNLKTIIYDLNKLNSSDEFCHCGCSEGCCCTEATSFNSCSSNCNCCIDKLNTPLLNKSKDSIQSPLRPQSSSEVIEVDINEVEISSRFSDYSSIQPSSISIAKQFSLKRGLFRCFTGFYKTLFAKYTKKYNNLRCDQSKKNLKMEEYIDAFIQEHFNAFQNNLDSKDKQNFRERVKEIVFSNRYKKNDGFLNDLKFDNIRKLQYSFKISIRDEYFSDAFPRHLFKYFIDSTLSSTTEKLTKGNQNLVSSLMTEIEYIQTLGS